MVKKNNPHPMISSTSSYSPTSTSVLVPSAPRPTDRRKKGKNVAFGQQTKSSRTMMTRRTPTTTPALEEDQSKNNKNNKNRKNSKNNINNLKEQAPQKKRRQQQEQQKEQHQQRPISGEMENKKKTRIVYKRTIRVRACTHRLIFFIPLFILALEWYFDYIFSLNDFSEVYYAQVGIEPWQIDPPPAQRLSVPPPLLDLTSNTNSLRERKQPCPGTLRRVTTVHNPNSQSAFNQRIPRIVHQTAKSRCLTRNFERAATDWSFDSWSYYLHDDGSVEKLLRSQFNEFPHLGYVVQYCLTSESERLSLWKFLVLWVYGGIYVDLNFFPNKFNATTVSSQDEGFFFRDSRTSRLSSKVMAMSPRHPMMYFSIQRFLAIFLGGEKRFSLSSSALEQEILQDALDAFQRKSSSFNTTESRKMAFDKKMAIGSTIHGFGGHHIRIMDNPEEFVTPIFIGEAGKRSEFAKMDMYNDFSNQQLSKGSNNCLGQFLRSYESNHLTDNFF